MAAIMPGYRPLQVTRPGRLLEPHRHRDRAPVDHVAQPAGLGVPSRRDRHRDDELLDRPRWPSTAGRRGRGPWQQLIGDTRDHAVHLPVVPGSGLLRAPLRKV